MPPFPAGNFVLLNFPSHHFHPTFRTQYFLMPPWGNFYPNPRIRLLKVIKNINCPMIVFQRINQLVINCKTSNVLLKTV